MASSFSVIPIRWLLTVDSEMASFLFHLLAEGVFFNLFFFTFINHTVNRYINKCARLHYKTHTQTHTQHTYSPLATCEVYVTILLL